GHRHTRQSSSSGCAGVNRRSPAGTLCELFSSIRHPNLASYSSKFIHLRPSPNALRSCERFDRSRLPRSRGGAKGTPSAPRPRARRTFARSRSVTPTDLRFRSGVSFDGNRLTGLELSKRRVKIGLTTIYLEGRET